MKYVLRGLCWLFAAVTVHVAAFAWITWDAAASVLAVAAQVVFWLTWYAMLSIQPRLHRHPNETRQLTALANGYELMLAAGVSTLAGVAWWVALVVDPTGVPLGAGMPLGFIIADVVGGVLLISGLALNGFVRMCVASKQIPLSTKVQIALLWWLPPATVLLVGRAVRTAAREVTTTTFRLARDHARVADQVCRTRHPLLLVHGVFFRDWPAFNYWGRVPDALIANGATISYGDQDASRPVADCGAQLVAAIEQAAAQTGKVNIIAHSKGGLDTRWAISQLGMADKVASLTTVNTPHRGCNFARRLLELIPAKLQEVIAAGSDTIFAKLGDPNPDFLGAVADLTDTECARLNELMPDAPGVVYLSVGSRMASAAAAPFPLNVGYTLISPTGGPNDGLVAVSSMPWGEYLGTVEPTGDRGLSHADMIDLMRRDVDGFDVREHYVGLVSGLRERGL